MLIPNSMVSIVTNMSKTVHDVVTMLSRITMAYVYDHLKELHDCVPEFHHSY